MDKNTELGLDAADIIGEYEWACGLEKFLTGFEKSEPVVGVIERKCL